jgi:hypothetical protein
MTMVQYGIHSKCNGCCKFCLIKDETVLSMDEIYGELERVKENIRFISTQGENWTNIYKDGVSLIGGELFFIEDDRYKQLLLEVIDVVIEEILNVSPDPCVRFSTVTNGCYDPEWLLYPVVDRIVDSVGSTWNVDVNFSYDLDYRFNSEKRRQRVIKTINDFHKRYDYIANIQMILTQKVIDRILYEGWRPKEFVSDLFPGNRLAFLYPHGIHRGNNFKGERELPGFFFTRDSFIKAMRILKKEDPFLFEAFLKSTRNSAIFKPTGLYFKGDTGWAEQKPIYSDGKEIVNKDCPRQHSNLYRCYSDSDKCMLCDLEAVSGR